MSRNPVDLGIGGLELIPHLLNPHVPGVNGPVDDWRVAAGTKWVAVIDHFLNIEITLFLQVPDNVLVGLFYVHSLEVDHLVRELAFHINGAGCHPYPCGSKDAEVIFAECRGLVNDACASVGGNVVVFQDDERAVILMFREVGE